MNPFIRLILQRGMTNPRHNTGQNQSALFRVLGNLLRNRIDAQRNFNTQMRTQDPAYQRGMYNDQTMKNPYLKPRSASPQVPTYKPPKGPKLPY